MEPPKHIQIWWLSNLSLWPGPLPKTALTYPTAYLTSPPGCLIDGSQTPPPSQLLPALLVFPLNSWWPHFSSHPVLKLWSHPQLHSSSSFKKKNKKQIHVHPQDLRALLWNFSSSWPCLTSYNTSTLVQMAVISPFALYSLSWAQRTLLKWSQI